MLRPCPPLIAILFLLSLAVTALGQTTDTSTSVQLSNQDVRLANIVAGSGVQSVPFAVDSVPAGGDFVDIMVSDANVGIRLVLPDGREINQDNAANFGFTWEVIDGAELDTGSITLPFLACGIHVLIKFPASSASGTYQVNLDGTNVSTDAVASITYFSSSAVRVALTTGAASYHPGDTIVLNGIILDGAAPVSGATVTCGVSDPTQPDADPQQIILQDGGPFDAATGDGVYTGTLTLNHTGEFPIAVRITGVSASGVSFSRIASATVTVVNQLASFTSFQDAAVNNPNGFMYRVNLTANMTVAVAGDYRFTATLVASNGHQLTSSADGHLDTGTQQLSIPFSADSLFGLGVDGPYQIKNAFLMFVDNQENPLADSRADAGSTAAYQLAALNCSNGAADLSVTNVGEPSPTQIGQQLKYSLTVYNIGSAAATGVALIDQLPPNVTLNSFTPSQGSCIGTGPVTCSFGDIAANDAANVEIVVTATAIGSLTNVTNATTTTRDVNPDNNLATSVIPVTPRASVQFVGVDSTTLGNWKGAYGAEGYNVINDRESYPNFALVQPAGQTVTNFEDPSTDSRALQKSATADRIAAAWSFYSMSIDVDFTDGLTHRLALYLLDWDNNGRYEQIEMLDPVTGQVLDSREISSFNHGKYVVWNVQGGVTIKLSNSGPGNSLVSGLFFDQGGTALPQAPTYTIRGSVVDDGGQPIAGVSVVAANAAGSFNGSTGADGHYSIPNVTGGQDYEVTPSGAAPFTPANRQINFLAADATADFIGTPALQPNGKLAFVGTNSFQNIYVMNGDGSGRRKVSTDQPDSFAPAWSPDGSKIAFVNDTYVQGYRHRIWVMNSDGTNKRLLTRPTVASYLAFENYTNPVWSPDGSKIAFTSNLDGQYRLYVMNANGTNITRLSDGPGAGKPSWSPDGTKLVFTDQTNGQSSIMRINVDGTGEVALSSSGDFDPTWSPDGAHIAFVSFRDDFDVEIYEMDADGANQIRLTNNRGDDINPRWSPDSSKILFVRNPNFTDREIFVMDADGGNQLNLTNSPLDDYDPAWSADGTKIAFASYRSFGLYVMRADGSDQTSVSTIGVNPVWQPAGTGLPPPPQTYSITVHVADADGIPYNDIKIILSGTESTQASTDDNGNFVFWDLPAGGNYTITPSSDSYFFSPTSQSLNDLNGNQTLNFVLSFEGEPTPTPTPTPSPSPRATTSTTLVSSLNPSASGQSVTFTANVTSTAALTGQVQFLDGVSVIGTATLNGNSAAVSTSALAAGTHSITAVYSGDANSQPSTSAPLSQVVLPLLSSLLLNPKSIAGSDSVSGTVSLTGPAPAGGATVTLTGDNSVATAPQTVVIAAGVDTGTFTIATSEVTTTTSVHFEATWNGITRKATLTVLPFALKSVTVTPASVNGGVSATGKVTLNGAAPAGGKFVLLASDNAAASVPDNVTVPEGSSTATFPISTTAVDDDALTTITATFAGGTKTDSLTVKQPMVKSVKFTPASLTGGAPSTGTITLSGVAPAGGTTVSISSNNSAATVPSSLIVAAGATTATFSITTIPVAADTAVSISAVAEDTIARSATLTVKTPTPTSISLSPSSLTGGSSSNGTINLSGVAPAGGIELAISSTDSVIGLPSIIAVAGGQSMASFVATSIPVAANHVAGISVSRNGVTRTANLTVKAPTPTSLVLGPSIVTGGASSTATLTLSGPAPAEGINVVLASTNAAASVPTSVAVPAGASTVLFDVVTTPVVSQTSGSVSATYNNVTRSDSLTVKIALTSSVSLSPPQAGGGAVVMATMTLTGPAPAGDLIGQLTSSKPAIASVPASITIPAGQSSVTFPVGTFAVTGSQSVTISATVNGVKKTAILSVVPIALSSIGVDAASVRTGDSVLITVLLNAPATANGFAVALLSSNPGVISLPQTVNVPSGASSVTITAIAATVGSSELTATANGTSRSVVLTVGN